VANSLLVCFVWQGNSANTLGTGSGNCYFKDFSQQPQEAFVPTSNINVAAIKPQYISGYPAGTAAAAAPPVSSGGATASAGPASSIGPVSQASACATNAVPNPQFYASATASRASSWLVLPTPTACDFGDPDGWPIDDSYCNIDVPQPLTYYSGSYSTAFASTNGLLSFVEGSAQFEDVRLPTTDIPTFALAPFWDDTAMFGNETNRQGIYYQYDASGVTIEYYLSRPYTATINFHYTVSYAYASPGVYVIQYLNVDDVHNDQGYIASVGMQGGEFSLFLFFLSLLHSALLRKQSTSSPTNHPSLLHPASAGNTTEAFQFSYMARSIYTGLVLTCDSTANICTSCTQPVPEQAGSY
jgi:hypothetical protein